MNAFFIKFILPIVIIIGLCITAYFIFTKPINTLEETLFSSTEQRIQDVENYERQVYKSVLDEVANEKIKFYIIMFGLFAILIVFGFQTLKLILKLDSNILLYPDKYEVIPMEEADCIRYLKDKVMEAKIIKNNELLEKEHVAKFLAYADRGTFPSTDC